MASRRLVTAAVVIRPPGDKSITHRALIVGGMLRTRVEVVHPLTSADARSSARVLRQLGVGVSRLRAGQRVLVQGAPWRQPAATLNCGNSGTTARLLVGALAGHALTARLTGDASLRRRPMRRVTEPLTLMGAQFREHGGDHLPLTIEGGRLHDLDYRTPVASAQIKSAILLAALAGHVRARVTEPGRSRDHTERLLRYLGLPIETDGTTVVLDARSFRPDEVEPFQLRVPGDPSSAAFLVGAVLSQKRGEVRIEHVGVNPTRTGFLNVLDRMGANIGRESLREEGGEPVADLVARAGPLSGTTVPGAEVPSLIDEVPILAVLAARAEGETRFCDVGELRVKESDRLALLTINLRAVGYRAEIVGDDLIVVGSEAPPAGRVETGGDHRMAMAFAVLGMAPGADVRLSEASSVGVSYPRFFEDLERIRAR